MSFQGAYSRITLRLHIYLGGYSKLESLSNRVGTHKGFVGCIQEVKINGFKYDMRKSALVGDAEFGRNVGKQPFKPMVIIKIGFQPYCEKFMGFFVQCCFVFLYYL